MKEGPSKVPWTHGTVELQHRFAETDHGTHHRRRLSPTLLVGS